MRLISGQLQAVCATRQPGRAHQIGQLDHLAIDDGPRVPLRCEIRQQGVICALAASYDRRQHLKAHAFGHFQDPVDYLLGGLTHEPLARLGIMRDSDARVQQSQVVVDLRDGPDGRARVARRALLVDGDRRRQTLDEVHVGLVHLAQELPRIRRQRLDIAALSLGVDRVERQRALARAGKPGQHDQPVPRQVEVHVLEIVLARSRDDDPFGHARTLAPADRFKANGCSYSGGSARQPRALGRAQKPSRPKQLPVSVDDAAPWRRHVKCARA